MQLIGHFIVRMVVISFGIFTALIAASLFLSFGTLGGMFEQFFIDLNYVFDGELRDTDPLVTILVILFGFFSSFYVASIALMPIVIAIAIAELMAWRGLTINFVLGGLVSLFTGITSFSVANAASIPSEGTLIVLLATGFIGGFFYWLIAGRSAGKWLGEGEKRNKDQLSDINIENNDR